MSSDKGNNLKGIFGFIGFVVGIPLSYFFQPGLVRAKMSLGQYIVKYPDIFLKDGSPIDIVMPAILTPIGAGVLGIVIAHFIGKSNNTDFARPSIVNDIKKCPKCAEDIKKEALVCKHCSYEYVEENLDQPAVILEKPKSGRFPTIDHHDDNDFVLKFKEVLNDLGYELKEVHKRNEKHWTIKPHNGSLIIHLDSVDKLKDEIYALLKKNDLLHLAGTEYG